MRIPHELTYYSYSIASDCPIHYPYRDLAHEQAKWLMTLPNSLPNDARLLATYEFQEIARTSRYRASCQVPLARISR